MYSEALHNLYASFPIIYLFNFLNKTQNLWFIRNNLIIKNPLRLFWQNLRFIRNKLIKKNSLWFSGHFVSSLSYLLCKQYYQLVSCLLKLGVNSSVQSNSIHFKPVSIQKKILLNKFSWKCIISILRERKIIYSVLIKLVCLCVV